MGRAIALFRDIETSLGRRAHRQATLYDDGYIAFTSTSVKDGKSLTLPALFSLEDLRSIVDNAEKIEALRVKQQKPLLALPKIAPSAPVDPVAHEALLARIESCLLFPHPKPQALGANKWWKEFKATQKGWAQ